MLYVFNLSVTPAACHCPGCGTQHPQRFACVLLAAAPTTSPCFCHWQQSSLLQHLNATLWGGIFSLAYFLTKYNQNPQKRRFVKFYGAWLLFEKSRV